MRIRFASKTHCAHLAKSLKRELSRIRPDTKLSACQTIVARMMGYRDWRELEALCRPGMLPSPFDEAVGHEARGERRDHFVGVILRETGLRLDQARTLVDVLSPTSRRSMPGPEAKSDLPYGVFPIEGEWGSGVAITPPDRHWLEGTVFVVGLRDGRMRFLNFSNTKVGNGSEALRLFESRAPWPVPHIDRSLRLMGYGRRGSPSDPHPDLVAARDTFERYLDGEALRCWAALGVDSTRWYELIVEGGPARERRLAFASAYPTFLGQADGSRDAAVALSVIDEADTPQDALATLLSNRLDVPRAGALSSLRTMDGPGSPNPFTRLGDYPILLCLPEAHLPAGPAEMKGFIVSVDMLAPLLRRVSGRQDEALARYLVQAKAGGTWMSLGTALSRGVEETKARLSLHLPARALLEEIRNAYTSFAYEVAIPAAALLDPRFEAIHYNERDLHPYAWEGIDRDALENSCRELFLEGLAADGLLDLCERTHRSRSFKPRDTLPPVHPLTSEAVTDRLDTWRDLLSPRYRAITLEEVARSVGTAMVGPAHPIALRKGDETDPGARTAMAR